MKQIKEKSYENYLIDENGNVYNTLSTKRILLNEPKILKSHPNKNTGYMTVVLRNGIKARCVYVHRLAASVYLPNPLNLPEVNHKNHNRTDNSVANLEWVTKKQNQFHAFSNKEKKLDIILKDKVLIQQGIRHYEWNKDIDYLSKFWKVNKIICYKVLALYNIERSRFDIPNAIRIKIIDEINNTNLKKSKFIIYIKSKYNIEFTQYHFNKLKYKY